MLSHHIVFVLLLASLVSAFKPLNKRNLMGHYQYKHTARCYNAEGHRTKHCASKCFSFDANVEPALGAFGGSVVLRNKAQVHGCQCFNNPHGYASSADHIPTFTKTAGLSAKIYSWYMNDAVVPDGSYIRCDYNVRRKTHWCDSVNADGVYCTGPVIFIPSYVKGRKTLKPDGNDHVQQEEEEQMEFQDEN